MVAPTLHCRSIVLSLSTQNRIQTASATTAAVAARSPPTKSTTSTINPQQQADIQLLEKIRRVWSNNHITVTAAATHKQNVNWV
jgi:hypothetical protein